LLIASEDPSPPTWPDENNGIWVDQARIGFESCYATSYLVSYQTKPKRRSAAAMGLSVSTVGQYSAPLYEVARNLLRSRTTQRERAEELKRQLAEQKRINEQLQAERRRQDEQLRLAKEQLYRARQELKRLREQPLVLPDDPPVPNHSYGPRMISVCVQLAKKIGLRASTEALKIVLAWLEVSADIPCWTSVRIWLCRIGLDEIEHSRELHDDWIWMADHSNQIGKEKVLTILGVRESKLPPPGKTLRHQDVRVLAVVPGTQWKREDVAQQYQALSEVVGTPKMLLTDGAVELRESAQVLEKDGKQPVVLRDLKHFAANELERMIGKTPAFQAVMTALGRTRSSIQQTELSHFTPPSQKTKARFMNLASTLRWAEMILWQLDHTDSQAREGIQAHRMDEKLGWLREYRNDIAQWRRIEGVIKNSLGFINTHGLYRGAADKLRRHLDGLRPTNSDRCEPSEQMAQTLIDFVASAEAQLDVGQRGWLSTEILESAFGAYKALEGQQSKGGFTSLLASFGTLLRDCSPTEVRDSLRRTSVAKVRQWAATSLGTTLTSKKLSAYRKSLSVAPDS
jgi:hypothetical protein